MAERLPSDLILVTPEQKNIIDQITGYNRQRLEDSLNHLTEWYKKQLHFPQQIPDKIQLIGFIIENRFSLEKTKSKLEAFHIARNIVPELLSFDKCLNANFNYMNYISMAPLRKLCASDLSRVTFIKIEPTPEPYDFETEQLQTFLIMTAEYMRHVDHALTSRFIIDLANFKLSHIGKINLLSFKKNVMIDKKINDRHCNGIHLINAPSFVDKILYLMKQMFTSTKMSLRLHVHDNMEELHEAVGREILPQEYGGDEMSFTSIVEEWKKEFLGDFWKDKFIKIDNMKSDETKRIGSPQDGDIFGLSGSFVKLNVD